MSLEQFTTDALLIASDRLAFERDKALLNTSLIASYYGFSDYGSETDFYMTQLSANFR
jgi:hypothetical protein